MESNLAYQEEPREELIDGEATAMSPSPVWNHSRTAFNIAYIFEKYLYGKKCTAISDGTDLFLSENNVFIPDMMVVRDPDKIKWNGVHGAPDLVAEVLSPSTMRNDRGRKKDAYEKAGVREYWIVNTSDQSVEQYLLKDGRFDLHAVYVLYPAYVLEAMSEKDRAKVAAEFRCSLFDDLVIRLEDVFYRTL